MNDHEDSRAAFEARYHRHALTRLNIQAVDFYSDPVIHERWLEWTRALDWRDSQVCLWKWNDAWGWYEAQCNDEWGSDERPRYSFCPACGRRVKIVDREQQTNETNEQ